MPRILSRCKGCFIALCEEELRMAEPQDTVLTIDQLADYLKLSKSSLYHLARGAATCPARRSAATGGSTRPPSTNGSGSVPGPRERRRPHE